MPWIKKANMQHNNLVQLENSMLMYSIYNVEQLKKIITTVHSIHNDTLFVDILIPTSVSVHHSLGVSYILGVIPV